MNKEMKEHSDKRTAYHIGLVGGYLDKAIESYPAYVDVLTNCKETHDDSKKIEPEYTPYVYINWKYKCLADGTKFSVDEKMEKKMNKATFHHIKSNKHHPECWDLMLNENPINTKDRDKPSDIMVDGTLMENRFIVEMCCDWCAVSDERGTNPFDWAKANINKRWKFTKEQEELIYDTLELIWNNK